MRNIYFHLETVPERGHITRMKTLQIFLTKHKDILNLSDLSRKSGYSRQYLKNVVAGRRHLSRIAEARILEILSELSDEFSSIKKGR